MEVACSRRLTIDDGGMYCGSVAFYDTRISPPHPVWWQLEYVHDWCVARGDTSMLKEWQRTFVGLVSSCDDCNGSVVMNMTPHNDNDQGIWKLDRRLQSVPLFSS